MESLYEPGKARIPTWQEGLLTDQAEQKANELVLPEGRRP